MMAEQCTRRRRKRLGWRWLDYVLFSFCARGAGTQSQSTTSPRTPSRAGSSFDEPTQLGRGFDVRPQQVGAQQRRGPGEWPRYNLGVLARCNLRLIGETQAVAPPNQR